MSFDNYVELHMTAFHMVGYVVKVSFTNVYDPIRYPEVECSIRRFTGMAIWKCFMEGNESHSKILGGVREIMEQIIKTWHSEPHFNRLKFYKNKEYHAPIDRDDTAVIRPVGSRMNYSCPLLREAWQAPETLNNLVINGIIQEMFSLYPGTTCSDESYDGRQLTDYVEDGIRTTIL